MNTSLRLLQEVWDHTPGEGQAYIRALADRVATLKGSFQRRNMKGWRMAWANGVFLFVLSLVGFLTINNVFWLKRNLLTMPPPWDQASYLYMSLRYLHALKDGGLLALLGEFVHVSSFAAPFFPLTTVLLYLLLGVSRLVAHLTNFFYLFLLLLGVYLLARHLYSQKAGILAILVTSTFTAVVNFSRDYLMDFPAAAVITMGMYAMIRSEEFKRRIWSLIYGVLVGLALLTKTMAGVFFVGPTFYACGCLIRQRRLNLSTMVNFLLAVSVATLVAAVWWGPNFQTALGFLIYAGLGEGSAPYRGGGTEFFTMGNLSYYFLAIVNNGMSFFYALLFAGLVLSRGIKKILRWNWKASEEARVRQEEGYLWMWLLIGYMILTAVPLKVGERFAQALLPPAALLLARYIAAIDKRWLRRSVMATAMLIGVFNYAGLTYEIGLIPKIYYFPPFAVISHQYTHYSWIQSTLQFSASDQWPIDNVLSILVRKWARIKDKLDELVEEVRIESLERTQGLSIEAYVQRMYRGLLRREPDEEGFQHYVNALREGRMTGEALIDVFAASSEFRMRPAKILVIPNHPVFNPSTLRYYAERHRYPLLFLPIPNSPMSRDNLQDYDFILAKHGGYQGPEFTTQYNDQIYTELQRPDSGFASLSQTFAFPDGSHILIFGAAYLLK
jgi:hypothetical protein